MYIYTYTCISFSTCNYMYRSFIYGCIDRHDEPLHLAKFVFWRHVCWQHAKTVPVIMAMFAAQSCQ